MSQKNIQLNMWEFIKLAICMGSHIGANTPLNAENGFRNAGIYPFRPNTFAEERFAAADTTDRA